METSNQSFEEKKQASVYGLDEMLELVEATTIHTNVKGEVEDYGELCDQDCIDCD